jgi:Gpi18-like mannosyltransferase
VVVACSRLLILAAGAVGSLFTKPAPGWWAFDPHRLSSSLGPVGNALAASALRWDGIRYVDIARHGYGGRSSPLSFPLYPFLIRVVSWVVQSPVFAGMLVSGLAFAGALALLYRLTRAELGESVANATVLLLAFAPLSFFFSAIYTESLLLLLGVATFYLARNDRFGWACVAATGATLSHLDGVAIVAPLAFMYWRSRRRTLSVPRVWSAGAALVALPVAALAGFFLYLHAQGYGWLAPITSNNVRGRTMMTPPVLLWHAVERAANGAWQLFHGASAIDAQLTSPFSIPYQNIIYLLALVVYVAALAYAWRRLPKEYAIYAIVVLIICTWSGDSVRPLLGFNRYMLPIFPIWMSLAAWFDKHRMTHQVVALGTVILLVYTIDFSRWLMA